MTRSRVREAVLGRPPLDRLGVAHLLQALADGLFAVSLAGSLFFSVSIDAARPRILLYLLLTMAPFAVLAPLVGPVIDRVGGGYRAVVLVANGTRLVVSVLLLVHLRTLLFYPEALVLLVAAKTYSVAKSALVPRLETNPGALVAANARLSRLGAVGSAAGGGAGAGLIAAFGARASLALAAVAFGAATLAALRLPRSAPVSVGPPGLEYEELHAPAVVSAGVATTVLRAGIGFLAFFAAFELKRSGASPVLFGAIAGAGAVGGLCGTVLGPRLRRLATEPTMLWSVLALASGVCLVGAAGAGALTVAVVAFTLGVVGNVGRQAFDSIVQRQAPDVDRGRAFARFEAQFQVAWVIGAATPVLVRFFPWLGLLTLGALFGTGAVVYAVAVRLLRSPRPPSARAELAAAVFAEARRLQHRGSYAHAVLEAALAAEIACEDGGGRPLDPCAVSALRRLRELRDEAGRCGVGRAESDEALRIGAEMLLHRGADGAAAAPERDAPCPPAVADTRRGHHDEPAP